MNRLSLTLIPVFMLLILNCTSPYKPDQVYSGVYLGLTLPDTTAQIFAPGFINTGLATRDLALSPDGKEMFFSASIGNHTYATILQTKEIDGRWTKPQVASFANNLEYMYIEPMFSADGSKLYFASNQPVSTDYTGPENSDIWYVERRDDEWGPAQNIGAPVNTEGPEFFPSPTKNGSLYFTRDDKKTGISYIYRSKMLNGIYQNPELLPTQVNAGRSRFNAFADPDDRFLIIPIFGLADTYGGTDYYISFHNEDDSWGDLIHLGKNINSESRLEYSASLSPDGRYLFFMSSGRENKKTINKAMITIDDLLELQAQPGTGNSNIYWTDASFIKTLRPENNKQ